MRLFASTSPSYLILQSLDEANRLLAEGYGARIRACAQRLDGLKEALSQEGWTLRVDEPLKLTLCPKRRGYTGEALAAALDRAGIVCEFADPDFCVCMFSPGNGEEAFERLHAALRTLPPLPPIADAPPALPRPEAVCPPREALLAPFETLPTEKCLGRVLAAPSVSCPPAVPVLVGGERIDAAALALFRYYGLSFCDVLTDRPERRGDA